MPRATPSSRSRRPLRELPLAEFLSSDSNVSDATPHRKRAHSPSSVLFSPAKRRILESEGIFVGMGSPARLRALPVHTSSPIKKPDFGLPKNSPVKKLPPSTPRSETIEPRVTRSARRRASAAASPASSPTVVQPESSRTEYSIDPHSIHYPGFVVHQDPFLVTSESVAQAIESALASLKKDEYKENVAPRKRARPSEKSATPDLKLRTRTSPRTPKTATRDRSASITPTRRHPEVVSKFATPKLDSAERRELRRRLEDEVDES
ncbi:hypothetical protein MIND_00752600 [Mycena indigotica]|uniref:Uncharacterized protein n=1 Tax=Mycena indigotica TaxID=2126181 RepID=A0A8H6SN49_9AGAR|nr:uncharacterized protein MIND_00752600 [Mycena indigotica]KAF7301867.1 hypothetical protein MIND_00752600 [Mycena indigotica]